MSKGASPGGDRATHERSRVSPSPPSVGIPSAARIVMDWVRGVIELRMSHERKVAAEPVSESERAGAMHRLDALAQALADLQRIEPLHSRLARSEAWQEMLANGSPSTALPPKL